VCILCFIQEVFLEAIPGLFDEMITISWIFLEKNLVFNLRLVLSDLARVLFIFG